MQMKMLAIGNQLSSGDSEKFVLKKKAMICKLPERYLESNLQCTNQECAKC
jgi:hypothetical protein